MTNGKIWGVIAYILSYIVRASALRRDLAYLSVHKRNSSDCATNVLLHISSVSLFPNFLIVIIVEMTREGCPNEDESKKGEYP